MKPQRELRYYEIQDNGTIKRKTFFGTEEEIRNLKIRLNQNVRGLKQKNGRNN